MEIPFAQRSNLTLATRSTHAALARLAGALGLLFSYAGYNVLRLAAPTLYGDLLFFFGVALVLVGQCGLTFWAMFHWCNFVNYVGRNAVDYRGAGLETDPQGYVALVRSDLLSLLQELGEERQRRVVAIEDTGAWKYREAIRPESLDVEAEKARALAEDEARKARRTDQ